MRRIDHIVIPVRNVDDAGDFYGRLGFQVGTRNQHPWGTENRLVQFGSSFLRINLDNSASERSSGIYLEEREGLAMLVLSSVDAETDAALFAESGIGGFEVFPFERSGVRPNGATTRVAFSLAFRARQQCAECRLLRLSAASSGNLLGQPLSTSRKRGQEHQCCGLTTSEPERHLAFFAAFTGAESQAPRSAGAYSRWNGGHIELAQESGLSFPPPLLTSFRVQVYDVHDVANILAAEKIAFAVAAHTILLSRFLRVEIGFENASNATTFEGPAETQ